VSAELVAQQMMRVPDDHQVLVGRLGLDESAWIVRIRRRPSLTIRHSTQGVEIVAPQSDMFAPGWPGIPPRWTSSAKSGLGTAVSRDSRVWFTLSHGILNEIYYPRGVPAYQIRNTAVDGRYRIEKEVLTDPCATSCSSECGSCRSRARSQTSASTRSSPRTSPIAAAAIQRGSGTTRGRRCSSPSATTSRWPWRPRLRGSPDRSGSSAYPTDGRNYRPTIRLTRTYRRAENGNVAVTGEVDLGASDGVFTLALGFGPTATEVGQHALISLLENFDKTKAAYIAGWKSWHKTIRSSTAPKGSRRSLYHLSAAVLQTHESKRVEGGVIASLSIPWGFSKGDDDLGGYHLTWPRGVPRV
jgi:glucoamylase